MSDAPAAETTTETPEVEDDQLAQLPADRLAAMLREKRADEAKVRARLREAETQRDGLTGTVQGFQRAAFERAAAEAGVVPTAIPDLVAQTSVADLLGEDGLLDPDATAAALATAKDERPHLFKPGVTLTGGESFSGGSSATWSSLIR
ncbi:hypothetical protein [Clavibacter capsici]|uniref:hypothetical protein n=1 Tax=Clavibacter capsici TaxID=1874630 RepID=UPI0006B1F731|nr:hypothetical protein [Clavibacter capsici]ALD13126.1 hypothetical protein AES38_09520 [Clavibacter capsici]